MASKQGKMQNLINYRMRITLVDGRQMTGQMLAFDKVRYPPQSPLPLSPLPLSSVIASFFKPAPTNTLPPSAHEHSPRRHRRIPQNPPPNQCQIRCSSRSRLCRSGIDRRKTHPRSPHPSWHKYCFVFSRRPTSFGSEFETGYICAGGRAAGEYAGWWWD